MKHIGIIAEYNPFHNGHQYQIKTITQQFPNKKVIVIMSGDFVQRGEPAIYNKYLRTECALECGADIVLELPPRYAFSSAEYFASAAVLGLYYTGMVDTICFGAENDNIELFETVAKLLVNEPDSFKNILKEELKNGTSFPKARAIAVSSYLQNPDCFTLLEQPNNILGIEYIKAIYKYEVPLSVCIIKRTGSDYHNTSLDDTFSSATALRKGIKEQFSQLSNYMPSSVHSLLCQSSSAQPLYSDDFYQCLLYCLWKHKNEYMDYFEMTQDISNRLHSLTDYPTNIDELVTLCSSKNYTKTRIRRILLNLLLNVKQEEMDTLKQHHYISYLRLLGLKKESSFLLKEAKEHSTIPIINKVADARKQLTCDDLKLFQNDLEISHLYQCIFKQKYGITLPSEYEHSVIIK